MSHLTLSPPRLERSEVGNASELVGGCFLSYFLEFEKNKEGHRLVILKVLPQLVWIRLSNQ